MIKYSTMQNFFMVRQACDFLDELADSITWLEPGALVLAERKSNAASECNWAATTTLASVLTQDAFQDAVSKWRTTNLELDWSGASFNSDQRALVLWIFPPGGEADRVLVSSRPAERIATVKTPFLRECMLFTTTMQCVATSRKLRSRAIPWCCSHRGGPPVLCTRAVTFGRRTPTSRATDRDNHASIDCLCSLPIGKESVHPKLES